MKLAIDRGVSEETIIVKDNEKKENSFETSLLGEQQWPPSLYKHEKENISLSPSNGKETE